MFHMMSDNLPVFLDEKSKTFDFEEEVTMSVRKIHAVQQIPFSGAKWLTDTASTAKKN